MPDRTKKTISMRVQITDEAHRLDDEETAKFVAESLSDSYLGAKVSVWVGDGFILRGSARAKAYHGGD